MCDRQALRSRKVFQIAPVSEIIMTREKAVALCCDKDFFPYCAFLAAQIADHHPERDFDICICSSENLSVPTSLLSKGITFFKLEVGDDLGALKVTHLPQSAYLRLWLADQLGEHYSRILYLDGDMFIEGGDLSELFEVDLRGAPLAAVRDMQQWLRPEKHIRDFRFAGLQSAPYFNSGLALFDTVRFVEQGILKKSLEFAAARPEALFHHDQSVLNCVLHRNWTELSPAWNWQWAGKRPFWGLHEHIYIAHYAGVLKPWSDERGICPPRYLSAIAPFIALHFQGFSAIRHVSEPELKKS